MREIGRANVPGVRAALSVLGAVVAEVDPQLRYVWIDNPHPDFHPARVIGKRDDELVPAAEAEGIVSLKKAALAREVPMSRLLPFNRSDGVRCYSLFAYPIRGVDGRVEGLLTVGFDAPR